LEQTWKAFSLMNRRSKLPAPQGLKPAFLLALAARLKAVPFHNKVKIQTFSAACEAVSFPKRSIRSRTLPEAMHEVGSTLLRERRLEQIKHDR
jgi:hypothetical protein